MIFKDERILWHYDVERLAEMLANKSQKEVYDILVDNNVIALRGERERPKAGVYALD
jgi:hypothetical protein